MKFRKITAFLLTIALVGSFSLPAFADVDTETESEKNIVAIVVRDGDYYGYTEEEYDQYLEQQGRGITFRDLQNMEFNNNDSENSFSSTTIGVGISPLVSTTSRYTETYGSNALYYTKAKPVTAIINGGNSGAQISYGYSTTYTQELSGNISLSSSEISSVIAQLGVGYAQSVSSSTTFTHTFNVGPGERARVMFAPMMRYTVGKVVTTTAYNSGDSSSVTKQVTGYIPMKIGNFADGEYYLRYE